MNVAESPASPSWSQNINESVRFLEMWM